MPLNTVIVIFLELLLVYSLKKQGSARLKTSALFKGLACSLAALLWASESHAKTYAWLSDYNPDRALHNRIATPEGYTRTACADGSYCDWLRNIPLKAEGTPVHYYNGKIKHHASHYAVLDLDTGKRDLQQCADAVMRLKAEYHFARQEFGNIHFNYTSGHKVAFDDWRNGRKPVVKGNKVSFTQPTNLTDNSYGNFRKYMTRIFMYAGSLSLSKELEDTQLSDLSVGDVFIIGGSPGHAVKVMDVAENNAGNKMFLLAQSYMPAQDMHILTNPNSNGAGPWYNAEQLVILDTPEWSFSATDLMRFKN